MLSDADFEALSQRANKNFAQMQRQRHTREVHALFEPLLTLETEIHRSELPAYCNIYWGPTLSLLHRGLKKAHDLQVTLDDGLRDRLHGIVLRTMTSCLLSLDGDYSLDYNAIEGTSAYRARLRSAEFTADAPEHQAAATLYGACILARHVPSMRRPLRLAVIQQVFTLAHAAADRGEGAIIDQLRPFDINRLFHRAPVDQYEHLAALERIS